MGFSWQNYGPGVAELWPRASSRTMAQGYQSNYGPELAAKLYGPGLAAELWPRASSSELWPKASSRTMAQNWQNYGPELAELWLRTGRTMRTSWQNYGPEVAKLWPTGMAEPWKPVGRTNSKDHPLLPAVVLTYFMQFLILLPAGPHTSGQYRFP